MPHAKPSKPSNTVTHPLVSSSAVLTTPTETHPSVSQIPTVTVAPPSDTPSATPSTTAALTPVAAPSGSIPAGSSSPTTSVPAALVPMPNVPDSPPSASIPTVPVDFTQPDAGEFRGYFPNKSEYATMPGVVSDLGRFVDYSSLLSTKATPAATIAASVSLGIQWRKVRDASAAWDAYVKTQDAVAWKGAMAYLEEIRPLFAFAVSKDPSLATTYAWLAKFFNAGKAPAKLAQVTKQKNAQTKAAADAAAAKAASDAATASAVAAAKAEATGTAPPPKAVTVNA
jgi:hypothetical protein